MRGGQTVRPVEWWSMGLISALMLAASGLHWWSLALTEVLGFITGGICVWLVVREHIANWPVGIANNIFFFVLFYNSRLYADMWLQAVYLGLALWGWLNWIFGGERRTELRISRMPVWEWVTVLIFLPAGTWAMREALLVANGAAPFWDAFTTALSLAAQYLLCRKRVENWCFWIAADIIYIPLYFSRELALTGVLYAVFLGMCIVGLRQWWKSWKANPQPLATGS